MARVLMVVAQYDTSTDLSLEHPYSPLGIVEVREEVCTQCSVCAMTCPTHSLSSKQKNGSGSLTFDAALCTACGCCLPKSPEGEPGAIRLSRRTTLGCIRQARKLMYQEETARCIACGAPIAPSKMITKINELLGSEYTATSTIFTRYCLDCRRASAFHG